MQLNHFLSLLFSFFTVSKSDSKVVWTVAFERRQPPNLRMEEWDEKTPQRELQLGGGDFLSGVGFNNVAGFDVLKTLER